ncbi:MAG: cell division protein FtsZ, partial [Muribaculaceae bacterium]|nr:cell division protein FtsZ [Muribaculaceae bacterium]
MNINSGIGNDLHDISDTTGFEENDNSGAIIKVIGVGGGGGNAVNYMFRQNIRHINYVVCNTDNQALKMSPVPTQLLLGPEITHGRGAGNIPEKGRECAEASVEDIRRLFEDETEMVFITAGMGRGSVTGAASVVAREA